MRRHMCQRKMRMVQRQAPKNNTGRLAVVHLRNNEVCLMGDPGDQHSKLPAGRVLLRIQLSRFPAVQAIQLGIPSVTKQLKISIMIDDKQL